MTADSLGVRLPKLLIVDDDDGSQELAARVLLPDFELTHVTGPRSAMRTLERDERFAAIVSDIVFPGDVDGFTFRSQVERLNAAQAKRWIFVSGGELPSGEGWVAKPYSAETCRHIHKMLEEFNAAS